MTHNKHRTGLGYNNGVSFHIPGFAKPIKFWRAGFLDGVVLKKVDRWQQCNRVGHVKDWCFDLHLCEHCGKWNHQANRCSKKKSTAREKLSFEWISSWEWTEATKKIYRLYRRICSQWWRIFLTLYPTRGDLLVGGLLQVQVRDVKRVWVNDPHPEPQPQLIELFLSEHFQIWNCSRNCCDNSRVCGHLKTTFFVLGTAI